MQVVVVGAGLAGLACARRLDAAGHDTVVVEASDGIGGRVRTDRVDGFLLDRGFQVLLTGYPAARTQLDLAALDLRPFAPGVRVRRGGRFRTLIDPLRDPVGAVRSLPPPLPPRDLLRLLAWRQRVMRGDGRRLTAGPRLTIAQRLASAGFSDAAVDGFLRPFLGGIFFDADLGTDARLADLVMRSFFRGEVAVPAAGMGAIPAQLAAGLPDVRLSTPVTAIEPGRVVTDAEVVDADVVVVATDPEAAQRLTVVAAPAATGTTTLYHAAPSSPVDGPWLILDGDDGGPVNQIAVMSEVAPSYAPPGAALVATSVIGVPREDDATLDAAVRAQLRGWFGGAVDTWQRLAVYRIPYAQPRQQPDDLPSLRREVRLDSRMWVCGDHRDTASIQGALVSGRRTADAVLAAVPGR
jgi:phytoene dehydrogenase-like protein